MTKATASRFRVGDLVCPSRARRFWGTVQPDPEPPPHVASKGGRWSGWAIRVLWLDPTCSLGGGKPGVPALVPAQDMDWVSPLEQLGACAP